MPRGYNTKGGSNGHFNHANPRSVFLLFSLFTDLMLFYGHYSIMACYGNNFRAFVDFVVVLKG